MRCANTDANAETTSTSQNVTASVVASTACNGRSSEREHPTSTIVAATGTTPR